MINFNALLEAAILQNKARLLASPKVVAMFNHQARIFIGDEVTYLLGTKINANGTTLETGQVNVGVELNVVAVANPDGTINLKVNPEVGSLTQFETQANGISLPRISRRTVQTAVRMKDGETLVIGGLLSESTSKSVNKLPILGDSCPSAASSSAVTAATRAARASHHPESEHRKGVSSRRTAKPPPRRCEVEASVFVDL